MLCISFEVHASWFGKGGKGCAFLRGVGVGVGFYNEVGMSPGDVMDDQGL